MKILPEATGGFSSTDIGLLLLGEPFRWSMSPAAAVVRASMRIRPVVDAARNFRAVVSAQVKTEPE